MATNPDPHGGVYLGPYVDPKLSKVPPPWGPHGQAGPTPPANPPGTEVPEVPPPSGSTTLGNVRPVYATDHVEEKDSGEGLPETPAPAHSPNSWAIEDEVINPGTPQQSTQSRARDYYRNDGMIGQEFFDNQG